jgi:hypothetical protein
MLYLLDMRILAVSALAIAALTANYSLASAQGMTPQQYHKEKGPCACPDDKDKAGKRCGKRSAFCQAGGAEVRCYLVDVERRKRAACGS